MLQLKVFYNVSFPEGESCEVIFTDQNIQSFEELKEVVRGKIECLRFIPNSELRRFRRTRSAVCRRRKYLD